jgi:glycosyltransferase involved in cell wall biosynthesis
MKKKLVDVIIPYYKKKKFVVKTVNSILNQSFTSLRVILIYDDTDLHDYYFLKKKFKKKNKDTN